MQALPDLYLKPISNSFSLMMYSFRLTSTETEINNILNDGIWEIFNGKLDTRFLFEHVRNFFDKNISLKNEQFDPHHCIILKIKKGSYSPLQKQKLTLFNNLWSREQWMKFGDEFISFNLFRDESILSPTLYLIPLTGVGILTFGISLSKQNRTLYNLIRLNYNLRNYEGVNIKSIYSRLNEKNEALDQENTIRSLLSAYNNETITEDNNKFHTWNIPVLIKYFFQDFSKDPQGIKPAQLQAFTFLQTDFKIEKRDLEKVIFRLSHLYDMNYTPSEEELTSGNYLHTFEEVHVSSTVDGTVIIVNESQEKLPAFLKTFDTVIKTRYIYIYLLAYHQRMALIVSAGETANLYISGKQDPSKESLADIIKKLSLIQLKCMFNEISFFAHINSYYYACRDMLRIPQLFDELNSEITDLNRVLTEKWHETEEQERMVNENLEKNRDKKLVILLSILIIPQIWLALMGTSITSWNEFINRNILLVNTINISIWVLIGGMVLKLFVLKNKTK